MVEADEEEGRCRKDGQGKGEGERIGEGEGKGGRKRYWSAAPHLFQVLQHRRSLPNYYDRDAFVPMSLVKCVIYRDCRGETNTSTHY